MPPRNVPSKEVKALKDHARDKDTLLLPADKAKATVVMGRADSDEKMMKMLNEKSMYQPVEKDPTVSLERKMNAQLMNLKRSGSLPNEEYAQLWSLAVRVPLLYGLPKVHKQDIPLRPIVPLPDIPPVLVPGWAPVVGLASSYAQKSKSFAEFVTTQTLAEDEILVSFEVTSLFTCIPMRLAVQVARHRLESRTGLTSKWMTW